MHKKIIACFSIIVTIFFMFLVSINNYTKYNKNYDRELNKSIIELVERVISVQYKTHCTETLKQIFTKELLNNYEDYYHNFFKEVSFYFRKNYMRTLHYWGNNKWTVTVDMHEGNIITGHSFFLQITIIKTEDGSYLISSIGADI